MGKRNRKANPLPATPPLCRFVNCKRLGLVLYEYPYPVPGLEGPQYYCLKHAAVVKVLAEKSRKLREGRLT